MHPQCFVIVETFIGLQECAARGEDYDRVKMLEITADDADRWERKKKKKNPDTGFAGLWKANFCSYDVIDVKQEKLTN